VHHLQPGSRKTEVSMSNKIAFKKLLEPLEIKGVKFRTRLVKTPQDLGFANPDGTVSQRTLDFYEAVARGGVGAIIGEHAYVDSTLSSRDLMLSVAGDKAIAGLTKLSEVVHKQGCPIIQQINHLGPQYLSKVRTVSAVAPSALSEDYMLKTFGRILNLRPLKVSEIGGIVEEFVMAAERVKKAGFDGVEIHADHVYLLNSFLSRVWNKRDDEYGCQTMENRTRFVVAVLHAVRQCLGQDYLIGVKMNGVEYGAEGGITSQESPQIAKIFERHGADYISVAGDGYGDYSRFSLPEQLFYPEPPKPILKELEKRSLSTGMIVPVAEAVKRAVSVPVIAVGGLNPVLGERILQEGKSDAVALGRRLFADPELPNKIAQGRLEDIVPCISCGTCADLYARNQPVACAVNPAFGQGREAEIMPSEKRKKVVVAGGGPAGMKAAIVAAKRGHEVTLFEKEPKLGGLLPLAVLIKDNEVFGLPDLIRYLKIQITRLGINVRLGEEFTPVSNEIMKPDAVILALGGIADSLKIPGMNGRNVLTSQQLYLRAKFFLRLLGPKVMGRLTRFWLPVGKRVVIIGGSIHGCEVAEFLVKRNRIVTIAESTEQVGTGILEIPYRRALLKWFAQKGVRILTQVQYKEITDRGLVVIKPDGSEQTNEADTILVAIPPNPNTRLFQTLEGKVPEVYSIGDGKQPRLIKDAMNDGFQIGRNI
jgi:2,4-dienoyl-CoA reductase (NADPH2)